VTYLTVAQAAAASNRHPVTLWRALESGQLHGSQRMARGKWSIRPECLDAWLDGQCCEHQNTERRRPA
jgi:hypothetical protein